MRMLVAVAVASFALSCGNKCSPENCDGCCDASGTCKLGNSNSACGTNGAECNSCTFGQSCVSNACFGTIGGGGSGGGSGFTGGGTGTTGGSSGGGSGLPSGAWVKQFGTNGYDLATDVTFDGSGNVYVVGGQISDFATAASITGFIRKFSSTGSELWNTPITGVSLTRVLVDSSGVYVVGGKQTVGASSYDTFVGKYDTQGTELWTRTTGNSTTTESLTAMVIDTDGSLLTSGATYEILDGGSIGNTASLLLKYSASGSLDDSRNIDAGFATAMAMGTDGRMLVLTYYSITSPSPDLKVAQYRLSTGFDWTTTLPTTDGGTMYVAAGALGSANQSFVAGYSSTADGGVVGHVYELGASGSIVWHQTLPGASTGRIVFDSASNTLWLAGTAQNDAFVTSFVNGVRQTTTQFGTASIDGAMGIALSGNQLCTAGYTTGAFPGFTNQGGADAGVFAIFDAFTSCWPR